MYAWGILVFKNSSIKFVSIKIVAGMAMILFLRLLNFLELANKFLINSIFIFGLIIYLVEAFKKLFFEIIKFFKNFKKIYLLFYPSFDYYISNFY